MPVPQDEPLAADGLVILQDARRGAWLRFARPQAIIQAEQLEEVRPALHRVCQQVETQGLHAAGFLSYEAGPAFDTALPAHPPGRLPLLWFGLYAQPEVITLPSAGPAAPPLDWQPSVSREEYDTAIARIKDFIARGDTYQVNYTLRLRAPFGGDAWQLFLQLKQAQQADYAAYVETGPFTLCSASPELFFSLEGEQITARPMKGTARRGLTPAQDQQQAAWLAQSEKDRAENVMIVDMLRNDLGRVAQVGSVQVSQLFALERYPTVWQMTSTVTARTQAPLEAVFDAIFPCASITGAPKARTMSIIRQLEQEPRQAYTGCIGFIAPGRRAQFNVAIRTVLVDRARGQAEYGVGGGIVWDSSAAGEYAECQAKAAVLLAERPPFSLLESLLWSPEAGYHLLALHLQRLGASADYFGYPCDLGTIQEKLQALTGGLPREPHKVRLLLDPAGELTLQAVPLAAAPYPEVVHLRLAAQPISSQDVFLYHKTTQRAVYDAARAACPDCDDVILWNERGEITETSTANLLFHLDGIWVTPPVSSGLLAGTQRAWLLAQGEIQERVVTLDDLPRCQEIAILNSVRGQRRAVCEFSYTSTTSPAFPGAGYSAV